MNRGIRNPLVLGIMICIVIILKNYSTQYINHTKYIFNKKLNFNLLVSVPKKLVSNIYICFFHYLVNLSRCHVDVTKFNMKKMID